MMRTADTAAFVSDKGVLLVLKQVSEAIILPRYKRLSDADISTKTDPNDFVTVADREAEEDISSKLLRMLPGSRCIGEESVAEGRCDITTSNANYTWIVDPIDGTRNFVSGEANLGRPPSSSRGVLSSRRVSLDSIQCWSHPFKIFPF